MTEAGKGLLRVKEIYRNRSHRVKELREEGKKIMGYVCLYPAVEIMTSLGLIPYRILGDVQEPPTKADAYLPPTSCSFLRSALDLGLKNRYDFLDGVVMTHTCDVGEKMARIWQMYLNFPYSYFVDTPHTIHEAAIKQHKELLKDFKNTLEAFTGRELSSEKLKKAIKVHNHQRALMRELYRLRKPDPPLISGTEIIQVIVALISIPVEEGNELLKQVIAEIMARKPSLQKKSARLLVWGSIIDDTSLMEVIEEDLGANVVMDDTCVGSRGYFSDVEFTEDPLDGLARHYLVELRCPRTFKENVFNKIKKEHMTDLENRFGYLKDYVREWNVKGVILQSLRYCDTHGYEVPDVRDYLNYIGLPSIYLEHDYSKAALSSLRTKLQAFLEVIS